MIAGEFKRQVDRLNGVIGDSDFRQIGLNSGKAQLRGILQQRAVNQQQPLYLPHFFLYPRQAGKRLSKIAGDPRTQPRDKPVARRAGHAVVNRRQ